MKTTQVKTPYIVQKDRFDASRPYTVIATIRSFNQVVARYDDENKAKRRVRDLTKHYNASW